MWPVKEWRKYGFGSVSASSRVLVRLNSGSVFGEGRRQTRRVESLEPVTRIEVKKMKGEKIDYRLKELMVRLFL